MKVSTQGIYSTISSVTSGPKFSFFDFDCHVRALYVEMGLDQHRIDK